METVVSCDTNTKERMSLSASWIAVYKFIAEFKYLV